ncbi:MAG: 5'-3' exonuclease [Propionibacteriaceae bacterium]
MTDTSLVLFDTASLYFRAFYALPDSLVGKNGLPTNAVRGLCDFVAYFLNQGYSHAVCCWDVDWRPAWRVEAVPSYKTHRLADPTAADVAVPANPRGALRAVRAAELFDESTPDALSRQIPWLLELLTVAGIPVIGADGYEADDVIATLARQSPIPVDIITGDRDLFQLVSQRDEIRVLYTSKGVKHHDVMDTAAVLAKYQVPPDLYADFALLRGDASDGLPGVAGIGEKTAARLLAQYGDIVQISHAAQDPTSALAPSVRAKLLAGNDYLHRARPVVQVAHDIAHKLTWDELRPQGVADRDRLDQLLDQWNLGQPGQRFRDAVLAAQHRTQC